MKKPLLLIVGGLIVIAILIAMVLRRPTLAPPEGVPEEIAVVGERAADCRDFTEDEVIIGQRLYQMAVADSLDERTTGLSGCEELPEGAGMYFVYDEPQQATYWMKGMIIPIDIIWVREGSIIGIDHNVSSPAPGTPDGELKRYTAPQAVTAVIELAAGSAKAQGLKVGESVTLSTNSQ